MSFLYIEPTMDDISHYKKIIKKNGVLLVCRDQLDIYTIVDHDDHFTFGFLHVSEKGQINGFVLCLYNPILPDELSIELICATKQSKIGKTMMEIVEEKAREMNIRKLTLNCIANEKLRAWYESFGFVFVKTINLRNDIPKVYYMIKMI
jgi:predicted GNAT family N-acyltransferase